MEELGDYTIQKQLGQGPFGSIYLAEHRFIKKTFALKVLPEDIADDPTFFRRFETEVAKISALDHPNIVKIHNVSFADGRYFLVMDPLIDALDEAMNLDRFLQARGSSLTEDEQIDLLQQVAHALDYAHENGVVHGSLKLTNILVCQSEQKVRPVLSDFGISRLVGHGLSFLRLCNEISKAMLPSTQVGSDRVLQRSRNFVRSFAFLAPEQKLLDGSAPDEKVDVYAFGVLAYYVLTQKIPEGCFDLPSRIESQSKGNWDLLINRCLQSSPQIRPKSISYAMEECLRSAQKSEAVGQPIPLTEEVINQMAFEFPAKEVELASVEKGETVLKPVLNPQELKRPEYEQDPGAIFQRDLHVSHYIPKQVETQEIEPIQTDMIVIPGGEYLRGGKDGARDESPRHTILLNSFALDVHPVTNEQFVRFLQAMGGEKDENNNDIIRLRDARIKRNAGRLSIESGYAKHPVVGVTWYGAIAYAKWVGKRLPTEAEWEAAAGASSEAGLYFTGSEIDRTQANFFSADTTAVMSYPPTSLGLYDMAGNVYEWCQDWYAYNYYETSALEPQQPCGPTQGVYRVLRGGCWKSLKDDLRVAHRHRNNPGAVTRTYGFRCAADVTPS